MVKAELNKIISQARAFNVTHKTRKLSNVNYTRPSKPSLIRVVVHECGNRIELSKSLCEALEYPAFMEVDYTDEYLLFRASEGGYKVSKGTKSAGGIIYCKPLAELILKLFESNDSNAASHSFCEGGLCEDVFLVRVKKRSEPSEEALGEATGDSEAEIAETEEISEEESDHEDEVLEEEEAIEFDEDNVDEEPDLEFNEE